ncbi:Finger protein azf1 [Pleurostoma richardsiae]|uniref:Finger protein azf1 n=1 Tax=Pleurostoma richardsiae TaxID=41990 RepID=A0AA38RWG5_9PEZI|nr:Finger protein azf1 [Pleurostoma richardsiae]
MGLVAQPPATQNWGRWPQQQSGPDFVMMDSPAMLHYDPRPVAPPALQPPVVSSPYVMANPYTSAPMTTMPAPVYPPQVPFGYAPYGEPVTTMDTSLKQEYHAATPPQAIPPIVSSETKMERGQDFSAEAPGMPPPYASMRRSSCTSPGQENTLTGLERSSPLSPIPVAKTVTFNSSVIGAPMVSFNTEVDALMKVIQAKTETEHIVKIAEDEQVPEPQKVPKQRRVKVIRKRFICDVPDCNKRFAQRAQLTTHMRCHNGERPYVCSFPGCNSSFGQHGNLKVHQRLHSGERPYACDQCHRRFAQRGNLNAHLETHKKTKRFVCKLDGCTKRFGQRGNLKAHQNKFHKATLRDLTAKFAHMTGQDMTTSQEDLEMWEYLATLYKNSNKGIKGRGKNRRVSTAVSMSPVSPVPNIQTQYHLQGPDCHPPMLLDYQQGLVNGGMNRGPGMMMTMAQPRDPHANYEMFDVSDDGSTGGSTNSGPIYQTNHGRGAYPFHNRMY